MPWPVPLSGALSCAERLPRFASKPLPPSRANFVSAGAPGVSAIRLTPPPPSLGRRSRPKLGGVAQLGERLLCKQEVIGSIPFTSTTDSASAMTVVCGSSRGSDARGAS